VSFPFLFFFSSSKPWMFHFTAEEAVLGFYPCKRLFFFWLPAFLFLLLTRPADACHSLFFFSLLPWNSPRPRVTSTPQTSK
jgi:hypothetical protein